MHISQLIENTLYFLALINPASKILFLSTKFPPYSKPELFSISTRSTLVAFAILAVLAGIGNFLFQTIFHVQIYSLSVAGGIVLFIIGLKAIQKGEFHEKSKKSNSITDVSIVPLAAPLIAGPGTMTAAISFSSIHGSIATIACLLLALGINLILMLLSSPIGNALAKVNATGPVIRITGLIVAAVAMQMIFTGCATWIHGIL